MLWSDRLTFATAGRLIAHTWCESGAHDDKKGGDDGDGVKKVEDDDDKKEGEKTEFHDD